MNVDVWKSEIQVLAQSGALSTAIEQVFGVAGETGTSSALNQYTAFTAFSAFTASLSQGDFSVLPTIEVLDHQAMQGHPGAYAAATGSRINNPSPPFTRSFLRPAHPARCGGVDRSEVV